MSCAHSFGEWCSECIDGMVQDYNRVRAELRAAEATLTAALSALQYADDKIDGDYFHGQPEVVSEGLAAVKAALTASPAATKEPECSCGTEDPKSARHGHRHLAWCAVRASPAATPDG